MPTMPIPFMGLNKAVDKPSVATWNQGQYDGYWQPYESFDGPKYLWSKRPGNILFDDLGEPNPIDGMHYWIRQNLLIVVCNGKVFKITETGTATDITGTASMTVGVRPTFCDVAGSSLYIASGGRIGAYPSSGTGEYLSDADAPTATRFIGTINKTLVALRDADERFDWADATTPTTWSGEYANAEAEPDLAKAMIIANNYLYFFGQKTIEVWRDDGDTFVRETQGAIQRGTLARYSPTNINGEIYFLDDTREVSVLSGFNANVISNPDLSRFISEFNTVDDARGDYVRFQGRHFYVLSFPTEGKTLVFDIGIGQWLEWSYWDDSIAERRSWIGSCAADVFGWNKLMVGDRSGSRVYYIGGTDDNGKDIMTVIQTDFTDRGAPDIFKFCNQVTVTLKRSDTATTPKKLSVSYRNNGDTSWSDSIEVDMEESGKTQFVAKLRRLGCYKNRMWRFTMSDASSSAIFDAQESFEYGR